jgi:uncharacterized membrane protein required for colicin V production
VSFGWFDFVVIVLLIWGLWRGRKHGMSQELLPLLQSLLMVVLGAQFYEPLGRLLANATPFGYQSCFITTYFAIAFAIAFVFSLIRKAVGEKLFASDVFGKMEFTLGMLGGAARYACYVLMFLAFINVFPMNAAKEEEQKKKQQENFGSISFPTFTTIHDDIQNKSFLTRQVRAQLPLILIKATSSEDKPLKKREGPAKRMEREVDQLFDKPKPATNTNL